MPFGILRKSPRCLPHRVLVALGAAPQRRRAHPLRTLEGAPLVALRTELVLQREVQVLRTRLAEHVLALVASPGELLDGLLRRVGLALLHELGGEHVDRGPVLGVHHREQPRVARHLHGLQDLSVIRVEDPRVRHEHLEARDALVGQLPHRLERRVVDVADDLVEPVIDGAVAVGLLVPRREAVFDALPVGLHGEVDDRGRAAVRRRPGARFEGVGCLGAAERQLHVGVRIDAAGDHVLTGGVDDAVDGCRDIRAEQCAPRLQHGDDRLAVDEDIGGGATRRAHHGAAGDEGGRHVRLLTASGWRCTTRAGGRGRTARSCAPRG
ncbi:MAG: hypothetical protein K0S05_2811 [Agromyces sp.]|nr:hypothetical protein [Agromyces sp.]